jgi:error-prone DNA polymerase
VGFDRERHADRFLKAPEEIHRLFWDYPEALERTREIVGRCPFDMSELQYQCPEEAMVPGLDAQQPLTKFAWEGAADRYPEGIPDKV